MRIHEYGEGVYIRQVLGAYRPYSYTLAGQLNNKSFKNIAKTYLCDYINNPSYTNDKLADRFGMWAVHSAYDIFGNSPPLVVTGNDTPLIDTGELSNNFAWKVSWRGAVHTL